MSKPNFKKFLHNTKAVISKNSPKILTGIGIAGMITTTVLAVKATPKAVRLIEEAKEHEDEKLPAKEVVKVTWKCYIPAAVTGVASIACLIGAQSISSRRISAIATAYKLSETALTEYKQKVLETVGEKKAEEIREKVLADKPKSTPVSEGTVIVTGRGETLCYDAISGRHFKSDMNKLEKAQNDLNKRLMNEMYISLNEFYDALGLPCTHLGNELGWNLDDGLIELSIGHGIADDDTPYAGMPMLVVDYCVSPRFDFSKLM